jgi:hypothetical protein
MPPAHPLLARLKALLGNDPKRHFLEWEQRGRLNISLLLGDGAVAAWLAFAFFSFTDRPMPLPTRFTTGVAGAALLAYVVRLHSRPKRLIGGLAIRSATYAAALGTGLYGVGVLGWLQLSTPAIVWFALAVATACFALRVAFYAIRARHPDQPLEMFRWVLLGGAGTALLLPYYHAGAVGTGDARWYIVMLADFVTQFRAGVFPVWVGQSEYAFNGATSPLRFAPWFQHAGGILDLLTARTLSFGALNNAILTVNGLASGLAAYFCLRDILPRRPGLACFLAILFLGSPGVLAPPMAGDQYMSFMATPFIPLVLNGLYRLWTRDDASGPCRLAVGLAGTWLSHAPIALWCTLLAVGAGAIVLVRRRLWRVDLPRLVTAGLLFLVLGSLPFLSMLSLDNRNVSVADGNAAARQVSEYFPANFHPIQPNGDRLAMYQAGYGALGAFVLAIALLPKRPPRGTWFFFGATLAIAPIILPVPLLNRLFWTWVPTWFVTINNIWPTQRLSGIWAGLMLFSFAVVAADDRIAGRRWLSGICLGVLGLLGLWSWQEARKLQTVAWTSYQPPAALAASLDRSNVVLSRYAYTAFAYAPAYLSHGYMDPLFENRILSHDTLTLMTANADRAAPPVRVDAGSSVVPRLLQTGIFTAQQAPASRDYYVLTPRFTLAAGHRYALRLECFEAAEPGVLQLTGQGLFREYLMPDSGQGLDHRGSPRAFGALDTSSKVMSLLPDNASGEGVTLRFVPQGYSMRRRYVFGRYWLYEFNPKDLAVVVRSWIPYRATVDVAVPAFLETPRMWLGGYRATVNGRPAAVKRSPDNLAMAELGPGMNDVTLIYQAPWWLRASFWTCIFGWVTVAARGIHRFAVNTQVCSTDH